jgi:hypothetical protein
VLVGRGSFRKRRKRELAVRHPRCVAVLASENVRSAYASGDCCAFVLVSASRLTGACASMCLFCSVSAVDGVERLEVGSLSCAPVFVSGLRFVIAVVVISYASRTGGYGLEKRVG